MGFMAGVLGSVGSAIASGVSGVGSAIASGASEAGSAIASGASEAGGNLISGMKKANQMISDAADWTGSKIGEGADWTVKSAKNRGSEFWEGLTTQNDFMTPAQDGSIDWTKTMTKAAGRMVQQRALSKIGLKGQSNKEKLELAKTFYDQLSN